MGEFAELGIGLEFTVNDPDAILEHLGERLADQLAVWQIPTGGGK